MVATIFHQQETGQGVDPCFHFGLAVGLEFDQGWTAACSRTYSDGGCFATRTIDSFSDRSQKWQSRKGKNGFDCICRYLNWSFDGFLQTMANGSSFKSEPILQVCTMYLVLRLWTISDVRGKDLLEIN